jgi:putative ABC transport system permease protein
MLFWIIFKVGLKSLWANKMRSILAMLGMIIGVAAVISMLALGEGAKKAMMDRFAAMGSNLLIVGPGQRGSHGVMSGTQQNLTLEDAQAIREITGIAQVAPVVRGSDQIKFSNKNSRTSIMGSTVTYMPIRNFEIDKGRSFTESQVDGMSRVCILGPTTVTNLFGFSDPIGEVVKIKGINFTVVGVTKAKGGQGWFNTDDVAIIPHTTAMQILFGLKYLNEIDIQTIDGYDMSKAQADITSLLRKRHRLQDNVDDDFNVMNQAEMIATVSAVTDQFRYLLAGIAAVSLLVGGIGIMNIMLVTVTERTKEIGIRKAVGAKERHILWQFLLESVIISGVGGAIGVLLGFGGAAVVPMMLPMPTTVSAYSVLLSMSFAGFVGIFFGFYPAWRAAMLDPVDALRYE